MRLLLDECIPRKLKNSLSHHECRTVFAEDWSGKKNGELLQLAEKSDFRVFVTLDRGIEYQQNLRTQRIAVILIRAKSNRLDELLPHVPKILKVLESAKPGQLSRVG